MTTEQPRAYDAEKEDVKILDAIKFAECFHQSIRQEFQYYDGFTVEQRKRLQRYVRSLEKAREEFYS